ncbi:hypothetical protein JRO89_XS02G0024200 [Xanthoceras sorbifolium]|uniref:Uncharacterized protein n=1 Tax=Xanthoceras sorbifolium TaxID=99658 RepID=A0ABQ8IE52_9ROSI|nr:hypothetical protein JRO89_XS02G0024200 [Xanthoceras sorbifolium]
MEKLRPTTWALPAAVLLLIIISNMFCPTTSATYMVGGGRSTWNASSNIQAWSSNKNFYAGDAVARHEGAEEADLRGVDMGPPTAAESIHLLLENLKTTLSVLK